MKDKSFYTPKQLVKRIKKTGEKIVLVTDKQKEPYTIDFFMKEQIRKQK